MQAHPDNTQIRVIHNRYQQKIAILEKDHISDAIQQKGIYDPIGIKVIESILKQIPHAKVFDIGANVGNHALAMARYSDTVHLFEPQHSIANLLEQTKMLNHLNNWQIHPFRDLLTLDPLGVELLFQSQ